MLFTDRTIIDSQSVKTTELATSTGFDAHKKVKGRKRHIAPIWQIPSQGY